MSPPPLDGGGIAEPDPLLAGEIEGEEPNGAVWKAGHEALCASTHHVSAAHDAIYAESVRIALERLRKDRTVLVIAWRGPSSLSSVS